MKKDVDDALKAKLSRRDFDSSKCKTVDLDGPYNSAGKQTMVSNVQTCTTSPCYISVSHALSVSTTLTTGSSTTLTDTYGDSVAIKTGIDFIEELDITTTLSYSLATAFETSTSTGITNGTTVTVTNTLGQALGSSAFVSFTPTYNCYSASIDCGGGASDSVFDFCQPATSDGVDSIEGDYTVVYVAG
jgi:hypothetical protein